MEFIQELVGPELESYRAKKFFCARDSGTGHQILHG